MTNDMTKLTILAAALAAVPALTFAQLSLGDSIGTDEATIRAALAAQGAEVIEIELEDGEIEVEYLLDGTEYEAKVNADGTVAALESDEDDETDEEEDDDAEDESEDDSEDKG